MRQYALFGLFFFFLLTASIDRTILWLLIT